MAPTTQLVDLKRARLLVAGLPRNPSPSNLVYNPNAVADADRDQATPADENVTPQPPECLDSPRESLPTPANNLFQSPDIGQVISQEASNSPLSGSTNLYFSLDQEECLCVQSPIICRTRS